MKRVWEDSAGNCRCESCGRIVPREQLCWDGVLGYCQDCYTEIEEYRRNAGTCDASHPDEPQECHRT